MQTSYPVIICGAGPTGLMLAAQLLRFGVDFLIVDEKSKPTTESRAVVVQARSMEIYEQMGLSDEIVATGEKTSGICFWRKGKRVSEVRLENFGSQISPFDFVMMFEQNKNEALLYRHLQANGKEVMWNTELLSYNESGGDYQIKITKEGNETAVATHYLVACDGAKSKVRDVAKMEFSGGTYEHVFYVADTHVQAPVCGNSMNFFIAKETFHLLFPMQGEKRFRAIGILPKQFYHQDEIGFEEISGQIDKEAAINLQFFNTQWYSTYKLHHKKVKAFSTGNVFFCGDAAHVHSPAGGQGMNTGLQDAYNLAWKLALVSKKEAKENLLATYHEERNPVAQSLLKTTDRMFSIMAKNTVLNKLLRMYLIPFVIPRLMKAKAVRRSFFKLVSQTQISYIYSSLSKGKAGKIKAGMRLPYVQLSIANRQQSFYQWVRTNAAQPFLLIYFNLSTDGFAKPNLIDTVEIEKNNFNANALQKAGFSSSFVLVLRPDNYIGYIAQTFDAAAITQYLQQTLSLI